MLESTHSREIAATPDQVFQILADFGRIAEWARFIQHSCLLTEQEQGVGATRRVQMGRQTVVETVTTWEPPRRLVYSITGLPPITGQVANTWELTPVTSGTTVTLTTRIEPGRMPHRRLIAKKVMERLSTASQFMLAGLAERLDPPVGGAP